MQLPIHASGTRFPRVRMTSVARVHTCGKQSIPVRVRLALEGAAAVTVTLLYIFFLYRKHAKFIVALQSSTVADRPLGLD